MPRLLASAKKNKVLQPIIPDLPLGEKEHIIYYHDESCFHAKNYSTRICLEGRLDTKQLLNQVKRAIDIFEEKHPNKVAVFVFDQSSAHASKGDGALNAFTMNLGEGGALLPQKISWRDSRVELQGHSNKKRVKKTVIKKVPKEIRAILAKRSCLLIITKCSSKAKKNSRILANHKDFFKQKSALKKVLLARSHKCLFLPKFHCELNPIEMYWAYCKNLYRQVWKTTFDDVPRQAAFKALDSCPLNTLRRCLPKRA
ncbi:hypothetical protein DL98DRAFT_639483 [Cadophora sp. DSE1049]|nr:hypothetical protein DL98DRAFT_639483 [Cadophora sp. DSE1049]